MTTMPAMGPRQTLHSHVVEELGTRIVHGRVGAGTILPLESLEEEFTASRTSIREALKVLGAKGLVGAKPRHGTYVQPRDRWNLLDLDVMRWRGTGPFDERLMVELDQLRTMLEPGAAALAATNRTEAHLERMYAALEGLREDGSLAEEYHIAADIEFHTAVLDATGNELMASLRVILEPALRIRDRFVFGVPHEDPYDMHAEVAHAIRAQHPAKAEAAMATLVASAAEAVTDGIAQAVTARQST